jgi:hypothetical protein
VKQAGARNNSFQLLLQENDEYLILYSKMIREFSEYQLSRLYDTSAKLLYLSVANILFIYQKRLSAYQSFSFDLSSSAQQLQSHVLYEENIDFVNDSLFLLLEILNHLSTKEFLFSDNSASHSNPSQQLLASFSAFGDQSNNSSGVSDVPSVLLYGLQMMIPLIQLPLIFTYPETMEKYLSFVVFLCNSSMKYVISWLNASLSNEVSLQYFTLFMKQMLYSITLIDSTTSRMALQVNCLLFLCFSLSFSYYFSLVSLSQQTIQLFLMNEIHVREEQQALANPSPATAQKKPKEIEFFPLQYQSHYQVLCGMMREILRMVVVSSHSVAPQNNNSSNNSNIDSTMQQISHLMKVDKKLLFDRIDSLANVFICFIVWNFQVFQELVNEIINQQVTSVQQLLIQYLQTLLTDRGLSLQSIAKKNRLIFTQNFRDFYLQVKNLTVR